MQEDAEKGEPDNRRIIQQHKSNKFMEEKVKNTLCEDDENLERFRRFLQAKGFNADLCSDGERGYKAFLKGQYDLCVLDG